MQGMVVDERLLSGDGTEADGRAQLRELRSSVKECEGILLGYEFAAGVWRRQADYWKTVRISRREVSPT